MTKLNERSSHDILGELVKKGEAATGFTFSPDVARRGVHAASYRWYPDSGNGKKSMFCFEVRFFSNHYAECLTAAVNFREAVLTVGDRMPKITAKKGGGACGYLQNAGVYYSKSTYEVLV